MKNLKFLSVAMLLAVAFIACEKDIDQPTPGDPSAMKTAEACASPEGIAVAGTNPGGNVECADLQEVTFGFYELSSARVNWDEEALEWDSTFPQGFSVEWIDGAVQWSFSPYFDEEGIRQCLDGATFIIKGGTASSLAYKYEGGEDCGNNLVAGNNPNGMPAAVSNVTICYNLVPCPLDEVCYDDETAWSNGPRYSPRGNWATYTPHAEGDVTLYAGRTNDAGTVSFSAVDADDNVTITIALDNGYFLNPDTDESVKIQGYNNAPSGNPAPGSFTTYKGTSLEVTVAAANFYGVHLDLLIEADCPEEE